MALSEELDLVPSNTVDEDVLTASLHNLKPEDIEVKNTHKKKKKKSGGALARHIILVVCVIVFIVCAVYLVYSSVEKYQGNEFYGDLSDQYGIGIGDDSEGNGAVTKLTGLKSAANILCLKDRLAAGDNYGNNVYNSDTSIDEMRAKLTAMKESFPDLYGWISIDGTTINHPIVQSEDNYYYLNVGPDNKPLVNGSIFADYRSNKDLMRNFNTVLYGHNLVGGGMFHDVQTCFYENEEKFRTTLIYVYTMDGAFVYEPFAVYDTVSSYQYFRTEFASTELFVEWAEEMKSNSVHIKDNITFSPTDRVITLSTCTNGADNARYALQAKLVQVIR